MNLAAGNKKDLLFYSILAVAVTILLYCIFFIDGKPPEDETSAGGLNTELPDGRIPELKDKNEVYRDERQEENREQRMRSLQEYMFSLSAETDSVPEAQADAPQNNKAVASLQSSLGSINRSAGAGSAALEEKIRRLEGELSQRKSLTPDDQLRLVEKSLQMAARYRQGMGEAGEAVLSPGANEEAGATEVKRPQKEVVTSLSEDMSHPSEPHGFNTAVGTENEADRNTIRACIYEDRTVTDGERVMLRLLEPLRAGGVTIPRNHLLAGSARITGDRTDIVVSSIECAGSIFTVHLKVYDTDGIAGIFSPGSVELTAAREAAANAGSGLGNISIASDAGQQIAMDASRAVIQGGSQLLSRRMRTVKVTLKANYQVLLLPRK
jgi:conjugative transposon TraM protein